METKRVERWEEKVPVMKSLRVFWVLSQAGYLFLSGGRGWLRDDTNWAWMDVFFVLFFLLYVPCGFGAKLLTT